MTPQDSEQHRLRKPDTILSIGIVLGLFAFILFAHRWFIWHAVLKKSEIANRWFAQGIPITLLLLTAISTLVAAVGTQKFIKFFGLHLNKCLMAVVAYSAFLVVPFYMSLAGLADNTNRLVVNMTNGILDLVAPHWQSVVALSILVSLVLASNVVLFRTRNWKEGLGWTVIAAFAGFIFGVFF